MIAKPRLDVLFLSNSHHHRLYHLMPCTSSYMHPNPSISDLSFCSCRPGYMLLLELFDNSLDEFNQKTITSPPSHPSLISSTISHHLLCPWNYPLTSPSFPVYQNSIPICPILFIFLRKPTNQSSGGVVDDVAIYSPYNSPFTDLNTNEMKINYYCNSKV